MPLKFKNPDDPELLDTLTPGTSTQTAPTAVQPPPPTMAPPPSVNPQPPAAVPNAPLAVAPLPGMPPGIGADDITKYLGTQKTALNRFGPDQQMNLESQANDFRNGAGYKIADAGKGFADAVMMGVAGAGNPGWQKQFEDQGNQQVAENMTALRGADESNMKHTEAGMSVDKMDPSSPLSKSAQASYGPLFQKLGYNPKALSGMSAANIESTLSLMTQYGGKEVEAMIKKYELEAEREKLGALISHQTSEEKIAEDTAKRQSLQDLSKMPWYSRMLHPQIAGALEESSGLNDAANKPGGEIRDVQTEGEAEALPPGTRFRLNGRTGTVK